MNAIALNNIMRVFLNQIEKCAQTVPVQTTTTTAPKYDHPVKTTIADLNLAISDMISAKTLIPPNDSMAMQCLNKCIQYLQWYRTIGTGGDVNAVGKDSLIPSVEELKALIKTNLFGSSFILSLASILKMNDAIPQLKTELDNLKK